MSADFFSFAIPMPRGDAHAWLGRMRPDEVCGDLLGTDEQTLHRFPKDGEYAEPSAMSEAYGGEAPPLIESAYVGGQHLELLEMAQPASSPNYPFIVALDRTVALPLGIVLLRGRACGVVEPEELGTLEDALASVGEAYAITRVIPHIDRWGNGLDDAREGLEMLQAAIGDARKQSLGLLVVGMVVP